MENASKALLIAGAILLAILIIGVGIAVFTNAQGTIDSSMIAMTEQEISAFNSKFLMYEGEKVSGTQVKSLLSAAVTNDAENKDERSGKRVVISVTYQNGRSATVGVAAR